MKNTFIIYVLLLYTVNVAGTPFTTNAKTNSDKHNSAVLVVSNISQLRTLIIQPTSKDVMVEVLGYYKAGDGGGGKFYYDPKSTETVNNGTIFSFSNNRLSGRLKRLYSGALNVLWFGAKRNNSQIDQARYINNAIKHSLSTGDAIFIPNGVYYVKSPVNIYIGIELSGENMKNTEIRCEVPGNFGVLENTSNTNSNGGRTSISSLTINTLSRYGILYLTDQKHYPFTASFKRIDIIANRKGAYINNTAVYIEGLSHAHFDTVICTSTGTAFKIEGKKFNTGVMTFTNCFFGSIHTNRIGFHFAEGKALDSFVFNACFFGATHVAELIGNGNNTVVGAVHNACHYENKMGKSDQDVGSALIQFNPNNIVESGYGAIGFSWNNCTLGADYTLETAIKFNKGHYSGISFNGTRIINVGSIPVFSLDRNAVFKDCEIKGLSSQSTSDKTFSDKSIVWENKKGIRWGWNVFNNGYYNLLNGFKTDERIARFAESIDEISKDVHYNKGDIFYNRNPKKRAYVGWICTQSGTPGKWKRFGKIK